MQFNVLKNKIVIQSDEEFNPEHILECGQVFSYSKDKDIYKVFPLNQYAEIVKTDNGFEILTDNPQFFVEYFDLKTDYKRIKERLSKFPILSKPLEFGYGIRILKQDLFETLISFIISANNNIKRIQLILGRIRSRLSDKNEFPSYKLLKSQDEKFFVDIGAGYRAKYLYQVLRQTTPQILAEWAELDTPSLRKKLMTLYGVGPKVADCILLFGYGKGDVFPVDTWIHKMYNSFYPNLNNREEIRNNLIKEFGELSGYAQQYLFYYQRSYKQ